jgi:phage host-nuclease inhibitor protein Gam
MAERNLTPEEIKMCLDTLKENQERIKVEYNDRIDKLENKFDQQFESIRQEIKEQTLEMQKTFVSRVEFQYTQDKLKQLEEDRQFRLRVV